MNKKPVLYMQTDPRWANKPYQTTGETTTIGKSGCGPTCAAMLLETLTGKTITPVDTCAWSVNHGYKALNQGTYYSYFKPQMTAYGIDCKQLNGSSLYGNSTSAVHDQALALLKQGYYLIACMGKGNWTSSGHFVVGWWEDGKVRINDPASTKDSRVNGDLATFKSQVKYYFTVDARSYNNEKQTETDSEKEEDKMVYYKKLEDVPSWCFDVVQDLVKDGTLQGDESGALNLSQDLCRVLVLLDRKGLL
jgi:hypothetical protein